MIAHAMQRARGGHWLPQEMQARRANLRRGRAALGQQIERLTEAYMAGVVPLAEYERRRRVYRPRLVGHLVAAYAARAAVESRSCRTASGGRNPCRSISQVAL
jgi:hypothetical protein